MIVLCVLSPISNQECLITAYYMWREKVSSQNQGGYVYEEQQGCQGQCYYDDARRSFMQAVEKGKGRYLAGMENKNTKASYFVSQPHFFKSQTKWVLN